MRQYTETYHVLEVREKVGDEWSTWRKPLALMMRPAEMLAYQGRLIEAIETAEKDTIEKCGIMHGIEFRCVSKSTTVTVLCGTCNEDQMLP